MTDGPRSKPEARYMVATNIIRALGQMEAVNVEAMRSWSPAQEAIAFFTEKLKRFA
jgi:hypothetical protein